MLEEEEGEEAVRNDKEAVYWLDAQSERKKEREKRKIAA